jgi:hypothetical protein
MEERLRGRVAMRRLMMLLVPFVVALTGSAFAQTADDILLLAQKGVGEDVMLAFVEASNSAIQLSADDIVKLKAANVTDKVVVAMLKHHPATRPAKGEQPEYASKRAAKPAPAEDYQAPVEGRPAAEPVVERVVEAPSTTYVYSDYPATYYSSSYYPYYPYYYSCYYPYYYPSLYLGFGHFGFHHRFSRGFSSFSPSHFSNFSPSHFSNISTGSHIGVGSGNFRPQGSFSGGFHGGVGGRR